MAASRVVDDDVRAFDRLLGDWLRRSKAARLRCARRRRAAAASYRRTCASVAISARSGLTRKPHRMMATATAAPTATIQRSRGCKPKNHAFMGSLPAMRRRPSVPSSTWFAASISTSKRRVCSSARENVVERGHARRDELQIHGAIAIAQRVDAHLRRRAPPRSPRACSRNPRVAVPALAPRRWRTSR